MVYERWPESEGYPAVVYETRPAYAAAADSCQSGPIGHCAGCGRQNGATPPDWAADFRSPSWPGSRHPGWTESDWVRRPPAALGSLAISPVFWHPEQQGQDVELTPAPAEVWPVTLMHLSAAADGGAASEGRREGCAVTYAACPRSPATPHDATPTHPHHRCAGTATAAPLPLHARHLCLRRPTDAPARQAAADDSQLSAETSPAPVAPENQRTAAYAARPAEHHVSAAWQIGPDWRPPPKGLPSGYSAVWRRGQRGPPSWPASDRTAPAGRVSQTGTGSQAAGCHPATAAVSPASAEMSEPGPASKPAHRPSPASEPGRWRPDPSAGRRETRHCRSGDQTVD